MPNRAGACGGCGAAAVEEEVAAPEMADAEFVSLEEADAEASGKKPAEGEVIEGADEEVEIEDETASFFDHPGQIWQIGCCIKTRASSPTDLKARWFPCNGDVVVETANQSGDCLLSLVH